MEKEFCLSDKIEGRMKTIGKSIPLKDVKEFIRQLKKKLKDTNNTAFFLKEIDKLAGDKLI